MQTVATIATYAQNTMYALSQKARDIATQSMDDSSTQKTMHVATKNITQNVWATNLARGWI